VPFVRSLPLARALDPDTLLAWQLNGEPLPPEHGHPLRVLVPGWYGVASVKWLTRLTVLDEPFVGHFQTERYVYRGDPEYADGAPVTLMQVRALITHPAAGAAVERNAAGAISVEGVAWSGFGRVERVEVSDDGGETWSPAEVTWPASRWAACSWSFDWLPQRPGEHCLMVRATDVTGRTQPLEPRWNELGYGNNVVQRIAATVPPAP
jgi:sulfane dehydrogenase subunit SoxC